MKNKSGSRKENSPASYYSEAFKRHVVDEVESGKLSMTAARLKYDIGGKMTVKNWRVKYARLRAKRTEESMASSEKEAALERRVRELERSLSTAHLKIESLETLVEVAEEELGIDIQKKSGTKPSPDSNSETGVVR